MKAVGLDKPCTVCGRTVYFNYKGPVDGVCGRCADRMKSAKRRRRRPARPGGPDDGRRSPLGLRLAVAFVALAAAAAIFLFVAR